MNDGINNKIYVAQVAPAYWQEHVRQQNSQRASKSVRPLVPHAHIHHLYQLYRVVPELNVISNLHGLLIRPSEYSSFRIP